MDLKHRPDRLWIWLWGGQSRQSLHGIILPGITTLVVCVERSRSKLSMRHTLHQFGTGDPGRPTSVGPRGQVHSCHRTAISAARRAGRSEEHTSELQSLMRISYAVFCLKKKKQKKKHIHNH